MSGERPSSFEDEEKRFRKRLSSQNLRINIEKANSFESDRDMNSGASDFFEEFNVMETNTRRASSSDVIEEGRDLFENFVKEEIQREGLAPPVECFSSPSVRTPQGYRNPQWAKAGKELREMADEFAKSKERDMVRRKANTATLGDADSEVITYEQFRDFLQELLSGGITRERIIVLFFFCSDLAIRTLRLMGVDLFKRLLRYSVRFISETVCSWVEENGGWNAVLDTSLQIVQCAILGLVAALFIMGFFKWYRK